MNLKFIPLLLIFSTLGYMANAQKKLNIWDEIEYGISFKKNLDTTQQQVQQLLHNNDVQSNPVSVARLYYYQMLIDDKRSEDSSFFKKSAFIDSILSSTAAPQLKAIMHLLQAKRLSAFLHKSYFISNKNLFVNPGGPAYSTMSREQLDSSIQSHFDASLSMASTFNKVDAEALLWLAYDPLLFLFKPSFSDIAFVQKLAYLEQQKNNRNYSSNKSDWLLLSADELMNTATTLAGLTNDELDIIDTYMQWAMQHKTTNANAYYFIETLARKFLYNNHQSDSVSEKRYEAYLEKISQSPYTAVRANGVYQLCLLWNKMAGTYNPVNEGYDYNYRWNPKPKFDTAIRLHYVKALKLYEQNAAVLDSFSYMKNILISMKEQMIQPRLSIEVYKNQLPGEPVPAMLKYRNAGKVFTKIIKVKQDFDLPVKEYNGKVVKELLLQSVYTNKISDKEKQLEALLQQSVYISKTFEMPVLKDYQNHNCFLKFEGLEAGRYFIMYSDAAISGINNHIDFVELQVTNIAVINNDEKVFVLNRKTGFPIVGASVIAKQYIDGTLAKVAAPKKVGSNGYITIEKNTGSLTVIHYKDTINTNYDEAENDVPEEVYDKDEYDNLEEYYEDHTKLHLFTDRAIYRPGQTVHFKGIFITRNPKNGEPLVLNWKNLKLPFYKKLFYKLLVKISKQKIELYVNDAFNRTTDTIKVLPNKFGSVAGSFTIAKTAATGEWEFDNDDINIDNQNNGRFKVEEYKRPSFEMTIEKPRKELQLNDSFSVKIKLRSFAGAVLNNVLVKYSIERSGYVPVFDSITHKTESKSVSEDLENDDDDNWGEAYTNDKGELELTVNDSLLKQYHFTNDKTWAANYRIEAEAIDATGESHEEFTNINLSNRPVKIDVPIGKMLDRSNLNPVYISAKNEWAGSLKKPVSISIYKLESHKKTTPQTTWPQPDTWLYSKADFGKWFPEIETDATETTGEKVLVYETKLLAGSDEKLVLPKEILAAGNYKIEVVAKENGDIKGEASREFSVYDKAAGTLPEATASFHHLPFNNIEKGAPIKWLTGNSVQDVFSIYHLAYFAKGSKGVKAKYEYSMLPEKKGLNEWSYPMPADANGDVTITHLYIFNNHLHKEKQTVYVPEGDKNNPEIIVENYRTKLTPGAKETFTVSIKTKDENTAAELMTTMYDASLDKIEKHEWRLPYFEKRRYMRDGWEKSINNKVSTVYQGPSYLMADFTTGSSALWWLNPLDYAPYDRIPKLNPMSSGLLNFQHDMNPGFIGANYELQGRVAGLSITSASGLDEVVVTGFGSSRKQNLTGSVGSVVTIRGASTFNGYNKALFIIDGVPYDGDFSNIDPSTLTEIIVLKDASATAIYGARAANGVILISTKGPVVMPEIPENPPLVIRKNFNESAFFFPQVHAGSDGFYHISFTMPESVTEWKWKMMAHTKNAKFAYAEKSIFTQLPLMVQPNMPRFLTQGDKLILKSRISNLDTAQISGTSTCIIEDAETGEDISSTILKTGSSNFTVAAKANGSNAFELNIPTGFLHPLRIKVVAKTTGYSDGEEHVIPVLSRKILVSQPQPFVLNNKADTIIKTPALPADAAPYGMGLYIAPKPQAAMLNSLPYLAFYAYGCAEQTFNKMLAYCVATKLMRTDTAAQKAMQNIRPKAENSKEALPDDLGEETMPWLQLNHTHELQQQKLGKLLDTLSGNRMIEKYMEQLVALQNVDGGITWFKGGKSDGYISCYILGAFGKLVNDSLPFLLNDNMQRLFDNLILKLVNYCDLQFVEQTNKRFYFTDELAYLHARCFWLKAYKPSAALQHTTDSTLSELWKKTDNYGLHKQAMLVITSLTMGKPFHDKAIAMLNSIKQLAINDDGHGTRWTEISNADDLNTHAEETIVRLAEAFEAAGQSKETVDGIIKWLLQNKQDHNWSTTKSTAAAIGLLNRQKPVTTGIPVNLTAMLNSKPATVTDNMFSGKLAEFCPVQSFPAATNITGGNDGTATFGGMNYYYFTAQPPVIENTNTVTISKKIERLNAQTGDWEPVSGTMVLKIADKLRTTITITAPKQLNYVFIDDKRAAALEPADASSGYEYANGFTYYKSVRDAGFQFFFEKIPSGISSISYQTVVAQEGVFSNGTTALTCMYQPAVKAYCGGQILKVQ